MNCDPMDELIAVSEEAGLYDDPCPDCDGGRVRCKADCIDRHPCPSCGGSGLEFERGRPGTLEREAMSDCPSCGGSGTRPAVTDSEVDAAIAEAIRGQTVSPDEVNRERYRAILVAAARARQEETGCGLCGAGGAIMTMGSHRRVICLDCADDVHAYRCTPARARQEKP